MFRKNSVKKIAAVVTLASVASMANATNMYQVLVNSASAKWAVNQGGWSTTVTVNFTVNNAGPNHICALKWTRDFWKTYNTVNAQYVSTVGSSEKWKAVQSLPGQYTGTAEYVVSCTDLSGQQQVVSVQYGAITTYGLTLQSAVGSTPFGW